MNLVFLFQYLFIYEITFKILVETHFSMIKEIDDVIYIGGRNTLFSYNIINNKLLPKVSESYWWSKDIMNGSDIGFNPWTLDRPNFIQNNPSSLSFDNCLNWKQLCPNESVRQIAFNYQQTQYLTPSGDFEIMNYTCMNSFIKSVERLENDTLWVCGTFGGFPRSFSVNKTNLKFIKFVDVNMMSCARYMDEPMATYKDKITNKLYVASGWGLYRPDNKDPDIPDNNSTMLYADWRLNHNLFTLPSSMAWVLSSDVNFINVVKETESHLFFFGYEINNQYGLNNQEDRNAWQSFVIRICKTDIGFKYVPNDISSIAIHMTNLYYNNYERNNENYVLSPIHKEMSFNEKWYNESAHLPTSHFVTPQKINFGCFMGKRPRAISDNFFWGETNVVYLNKLADVIFDPNRRIKYKTKNNNDLFGCNSESHSQLPLLGIFNSGGIKGTQMSSTGALCQLQINENIFREIGSKKSPYQSYNMMGVANAYEEIMALSSTSNSNFYSSEIHRTNGYTIYPYWNQGVLIGDHRGRPYYKNVFDHTGTCQNKSFYTSMDKSKFLKIQNFSNTAWPNELPNKLTSISSAICQYSAVELYSFNASFVVPGVEFKKIFVIEENYTNYYMHNLLKESDDDRDKRRKTSPLIIVGIVSTSGKLYRVVLCDFDNAISNYGENQTLNEWYNWCIFRHSDQPYLYRQYAPMEKRERGQSYLYRASSLLQEQTIVNDKDLSSYPINKDPQFHIVKDVLRKGDYLHVLTSVNIHPVKIKVNCNSYKKCINCASDPLCMWQIQNKICVDYEETMFNITTFMQDVLDRGFKCATVQMYTVSNQISISSVMLFNCSNAGFWRGRILWRIKGNELDVTDDKVLFINKNNNLMIINDFTMEKYGENITCHGINEDYDKLFKGKEYNLSLDKTEILLNEFIIVEVIRWKLAFIIVFPWFLILLIIIAWKKRKRVVIKELIKIPIMRTKSKSTIK